jgi:hypothetical protein
VTDREKDPKRCVRASMEAVRGFQNGDEVRQKRIGVEGYTYRRKIQVVVKGN